MIKELRHLSKDEKIQRFDLMYKHARDVYDCKLNENRLKDYEHYCFEEMMEDCLAIDPIDGCHAFWDHWNSLPEDDC